MSASGALRSTTSTGAGGTLVSPFPVRGAASQCALINGVLFLTRFLADASLSVSRFAVPVCNATAGGSLMSAGLWAAPAGSSTYSLVARTAPGVNALAGSYVETVTPFDATLRSSYLVQAGGSYLLGLLAVGQTSVGQVSGTYNPCLYRDGNSYQLPGQTSLPSWLTLANLTPASDLTWVGLLP